MVYENVESERSRLRWIQTRDALVALLRSLRLNGGHISTYSVHRANAVMASLWPLPRDAGLQRAKLEAPYWAA